MISEFDGCVLDASTQQFSQANGGTIGACPPCSALRGHTEADFVDGVTITGAGPFHDLVQQGAATLCF